MDHPAVSIPSVNDALEFAYNLNNAGEDSFSPNKDDRRGAFVHPFLVSEMIFSKGTSTNELNKAIIVKDLEFGASDILFEGGIFNKGGKIDLDDTFEPKSIAGFMDMPDGSKSFSQDFKLPTRTNIFEGLDQDSLFGAG